jgi:enterochelin esterase-like enzyme
VYNGGKWKMGLKKMIKESVLLFVFLLLAACSKGETDRPVIQPSMEPLAQSRMEKLTFHSKSLDTEMNVNVYVPKGYTSTQAYPVLYLIHGYNGNESTWVKSNGIDLVADKLIDAGTIEPLIIVMPAIDNSYGINSANKFRVVQESPARAVMGPFEDYFIQDVVGLVDKRFSTIKNKEGRYIGGKSMGGFVALSLGMRHPDMFSKVGGHSPALFLPSTNIDPGVVAWIFPDEQTRKTRDPLIMAESQELSGVSFYLDCGTEDHYGFAEGVKALHEKLQQKGVDSTLSLGPGGHDSATYTNLHLEEYMSFYAGIR